jgi:sugar phosphate isomerase/epimerase
VRLLRRGLLRCAAGVGAGLLLAAPAVVVGEAAPQRTKLGLVSYCLGIRERARQAGRAPGPTLGDPTAFLEECHRMGAGGMQVSLGARDDAELAALRTKAEAWEMRVEAILTLPRDAPDLDRFEKEVVAAAQAGAAVARTAMLPGRRYEEFATAEAYRAAAERGLKSLQLAEPVAARHHLRLAIENHKDHRTAEKIGVLKRLGSEYVGACIDVGNNLALLEDPVETVRALAPWALTVHLKDHAVREYDEGFLLADAALGEGFLDLPAIVQIVRKARPAATFNLEVITRDPLKVPVLTDKYWATFDDVPGRDLARTLRLVKAHASPAPLPTVSDLPPERQVEVEAGNVTRSLAYARDKLGL